MASLCSARSATKSACADCPDPAANDALQAKCIPKLASKYPLTDVAGGREKLASGGAMALPQAVAACGRGPEMKYTSSAEAAIARWRMLSAMFTGISPSRLPSITSGVKPSTVTSA